MRTNSIFRALLLVLCATVLSATNHWSSCSLVNGGGVIDNTKEDGVIVTCSDPKFFELFIFDGTNDHHVHGNKASCSNVMSLPNYEWKDKDNNVIRDAEKVHFVCHEATSSPSSSCPYKEAEGIKFYKSDKLRCKSDNSSLKAIEFNSNRYYEFVCNITSAEWTAEGKKIADTSAALNVACVEFCASSGNARRTIEFVTAPDHKRIKVDCDSDSELFLNDEKVGGKAACSLATGWHSTQKELSSDPMKPMKFECRQAPTTSTTMRPPTECLKHVLATGVNIEEDADGQSWEVKCADESLDLFVEGLQVIQNSAKCTRDDGWTAGLSDIPLPSTTGVSPVHFDCRKDACSVSFLNASGLHFDNGEKQLSCKGEPNSLHWIQLDSNLYPRLKCDSGLAFWKEATGLQKKVVDASRVLPVTCVQRCASSGEGINVELTQFDSLYVSCRDSGHELFHKNQKVEGSKAICAEGVWQPSESSRFLSLDTTSNLAFECRAAPATLPPTTTAKILETSTAVPDIRPRPAEPTIPRLTTSTTGAPRTVSRGANDNTINKNTKKPRNNGRSQFSKSGAADLPLPIGFSIGGIALLLHL